jgi:xylose dehydrogenase (NAD/NADP)
VSRSGEKAERIAEDFGVGRGITVDQFHDGTAGDEYDAIYVCTPNALHLPFVESAAASGKHILCEKPMEATVERAERIVSAVEDSESRLMVAYRMQTEPGVRWVRRLVEDGFVGEPVQIHGHNSQPLLDIISDPDQWRLNPDLSGYGSSVMDIGLYPLNTARFVLGADPVTVQSTMDTRHDEFRAIRDEYAAFSVVFDDDTQAVCTASQNAYDSTNLRITGTAGEINVEPAFHMETDITLSRGDTTAELTTEDVDQVEEVFDFFADRLLSDHEILADETHGLADMETLERIYRAAETGRTLDV